MRGERRVGWIHRVGPFAAIGTTPAALMLGGGIAQLLHDAFLPSILLGALLVLTLTYLHGVKGQARGKAFTEIATEVLGPRLSLLASLLVAVLMIGWFAFAIGVGGTALSQLTGTPSVVGVVIYSLLVALLSRAGIGRWNWVAIASIATTAAFVVWSAAVLRPPVGPISLDGSLSIPGVVVGSSLVLGYASAFALRSPDFTRDLGSKRDVLKASLVGLAIPLTAFTFYGAAVYLAFLTWDLPQLLILAGVPLLANLFLVVGFASSSLTNLFSAELASSHLTGLSKDASYLLVLVIGGTVAALGFYQLMVLWLAFLAIFVPPLVLTLVLGTGERHRGFLHIPALAWASGTVLGLLGWLLGSQLYLVMGLIPPVLVLGTRRSRSGRG